MNSQDFGDVVAPGLKALAAAHRDALPPERVQTALLDAFRRRAPRPVGTWRRWLPAAAALFLMVAVAALLVRERPAPPRAPEITTGYFPLVGGGSFEGVAVIRMKLPRSVLVSFGLPMNPDRAAEPVQADVAIGPDGTARAVRFVM